MAIVKMKKLRVMAMASEQEALMRQLLRLGCVEVREPADKLADPAWAALLKRSPSQLVQAKAEAVAADTALAALKRYAGLKGGLFIQRRPISEEEFLGSSMVDAALTVVQEINRQLQTIARLQNESHRLQARHANLIPWRSLELPLEAQGTEHVLYRPGVCPGATDLTALTTELEAQAAAQLLEASADKQQRYLLLLCYRPEEEAAMQVLRSRGFSAVSFADFTGTPAENLQQLQDALAENQAQQEQAAAAICAHANALDLLQVYTDRLAAETALQADTERLLTDDTILFFEGWAPAKTQEQVTALLDYLGCAWEFSDPTEEEIPEVPVRLQNNRITRALNMVTEMYSLPAYNTVDPNPLMAPFFFLFYGVMMADMGYGLLMILGSLFVTKKYHPKGTAAHLFSLMGLCGCSTFVMGAITGGFFGDFPTQVVKLTTGADFVLPALFTPLDDTLMILIGAMCLGFVHLMTGMAVSFVGKIKRKEYMDALWEEVTWWLVFIGAGLAVLGVTKLVILVAGVMILVGSGWNAKGFGKITAVFGSLYNHVTGYFGDILSYSRLMALMLAGSVIAQVFNTLGAIPGNIFLFLIISTLGNALNFALNLLGCYVHDLRLQCLEFFGKFYQDGGKPFEPLSINTKYVDIENI